MADTIEQFAHGKLIEGGRDVRGYTVVARSPGAPDDEWIARIRAQADIGQIYNLSTFNGADTAFVIGDYAVVARLQRSPRPYTRGYFLQEHYLVLSCDAFATLGNNWVYLHAALPAEIPWRTQEETLPSLNLPVRQPADEIHRVADVLNQHREFLLQSLALFLTQQPLILMPPPHLPASLLFEALTLLVPPAFRTNVSWANGVVDAQRCSARLKILGPGASGIERHVVVHPGDAIATLSSAASSYVSTLRLYLDRFGASTLLSAIESLTLPTPMSQEKQVVYLGEELWHRLGALILDYDIRQSRVTDFRMLFDNLMPVLDQNAFVVSPEQRSLFLVTLVQGALDGTVSIQETERIPRDVERASAESLWQGLETTFVPGVGARETNRWQILFQWRQNKAFWEMPRTQQFLYAILCRELDSFDQAQQALERLRHWANNGWLPLQPHAQAELINRASKRGGFPAELLVATWVDAINDAPTAHSIVQTVPTLKTVLNDTRFAYVLHALNGASAGTIDAMLGTKSRDELASSADLFLSLALMGERVGLLGLRAPRLINTLRENVHQLPPGRIKRLLALWEPHLTTMDSVTAGAIVDLMLTVGSVAGINQLIAADWRWIDVPLRWLYANPISAPGYAPVLNLVLDWFKRPLTQAPMERHKRLAEFFALYLQQTNGRGSAVGELTLLMLCDALRGETLAPEPRTLVKIFRWGENELTRRITRGIRAVRETLITQGIPLGEWYRAILLQAYQTVWTDRALTGKLISALKSASLAEEAQWLGAWNLQVRGTEILANLTKTAQSLVECQNDLMAQLEEAEEMTAQQIVTWMPNPEQRRTLYQQLGEISEGLEQLKPQIYRFQEKIR
jgi:hypothetical protein